jgi:hypothetical protein
VYFGDSPTFWKNASIFKAESKPDKKLVEICGMLISASQE